MTLIIDPPPARRRVARPDPHRGPKARLDEALKPDTTLRRVGREPRILLKLAPLLMLPFAGAAALALQPAQWGISADWRTWIDPLAFVTVGLTIGVVFALGVKRVVRAWEISGPSSPETALREFYRAACRRRPRPKRLALLVRGFDLPGQPGLRPVLNWMTAAGFPRIDSAKTLARYWRSLVHGNNTVSHNFRIQDMQVDFPKPEVALARITMQTWVTRKVPAATAAVCGALVAAAPMISGPERLYGLGIPFWGAVVTAFGLGAGVTLLVRKLNRTVVERRNVAINKILVHASWNWRLLSGEWESADEADVRWLIPKKQ
jgi:hypothetical protein